jgi:hypothetical protein
VTGGKGIILGAEKPSRSRFIGETEHKALYHYERFVAERLSATLRDQRIYCSNPAGFNDPWDCRPWFDEEALETPERLERVLTFLRKHKSADFDDKIIDIEIWEARVRAKRYERVTLNTSLSELLRVTVHKRRIYCLTPDPSSTLLWSHYTENHRGICLEFGIDNPLFQLALEVLYPATYPVWSIDEIEDEHQRAVEMILAKAKPWEYEKEFRIISPHNTDLNVPTRVVDGCFELPPGTLKSVIAGCDADYDAIKAIVHHHMPDLPVKRAFRSPNNYRLAIVDEHAD